MKIYLAGDSTVRDYDKSRAPQAGWGQFLPDYLDHRVTVENHAIGGRSSKTFITEGRLERIMDEIRPNDYLFIQFGHNDSTKDRPERYTVASGDYKIYLQTYIDDSRSKRATPILFTPVARLHVRDGVFLPNFEEYCVAMKEVAEKENVMLIDLMTESLRFLESLGYERAKELYMISVDGEDCTHFTEKGANRVAEIVAREIKKMSTSLADYVKSS